jgi:hypothetical protein
MPDQLPPAIILCSGQSTRLRDMIELLPKPIAWHITPSSK